ncbi:L-lactate dehydrogenase [Microcella putealis]|uniref:L-lactate dehydrogenase n=1 Tax=Microcella putealis TaxID=337005 RepID=A0A4Q7LJX7_9MICO|nr:L-lactate dehydrogenase [Microcella putealis]RZS54363.1 L-lactate dehydrogenase [Microcella putealis]TQM24883.1 L-lactate dehydrogenase [Microcella putealis]
MPVLENSRLAIVGAGAVGTALAYASLIRETAREVVLYDIDEARVNAEILDLAHGTPFTGSSAISGGADLDVVAGANVVVVTAGAKQHPGQSRLDLAGVNVEILRDLMPALVERAPDAVFMLVTNPCDVLAVAAQRFSGLEPSRVFSSGTVLDSSRLRWRLAERLGVSASSVHAMIVGEHGDSEFPLWSQSRIGPIPIRDWRDDAGENLSVEELDEIADDVKNAAYTVIAGKGATNYAIGLSGARIVEAIFRDEGAILPVSSVLSDYHGVDGVALSVPSIVDAGGVSRVIDTPFSAEEERQLHHSASAIRASLEALGLS